MLDRFLKLPVSTDRPFLKQNFVANVFDGALFSFAMSFVSLQTVIPVFVKKLGGSNGAVGLIPVLWTVGFNFPQIFVANYAQRFACKKRFMLTTALLQRIPWLLLAGISYFVADTKRGVGLLLFFAVLSLAAVSGSINLPVWFDLIAKITPVDLRGRLFATRLVLGAMLGMLGGWVVVKVLDSMAYPEGFALLFLLAFAAMMASYLFLVMLKERDGSFTKRRLSYTDYLLGLPKILKEERSYRNFLVADALLTAATMASAFYTVNAFEKFSLSDAYAGTFTIVVMCSTMVGNLFFGYLADHLGHRLNLVLAALFTVVSCVLAVLAPSVEVYCIVFAGAALSVGLSGISRLSIIAEFASEAERPTYIALTNMITSSFALSGIAGGWIADRFGYDVVFMIAAILALISAAWLTKRIEEPRKMNHKRLVERVPYET